LTGTTRDKRGCVGQAGTIPGVDENHREAITDADATGLIAGEKLITEAETLRPLLPHQHLRAEIESAAPNRQTIEGHVRTLRALPELEAAVANWWDDPKTQRFIAYLSQIGL
jgi:hypothetical protein